MNKLLRNTFYVIAFLVIAGVLIYRQQQKAERRVYYYGFYDNVNGLDPGSSVELSGVSVGKVHGLKVMPQGNVRVTIYMFREMQVKRGTVARLQSSGISGGKNIKLEEASGENIYLTKGSVLATRTDTTLMENASAKIKPVIHDAKIMLQSLDSGLTSFNQILRGGLVSRGMRILSRLDSNTHSINERIKKVNDSLYNYTRNIRSANAATGKMAANGRELDRKIDSTAASSEALRQKDLKQATADISAKVKKLNSSLESFHKKQSELDLAKTARSLDSLNRNLRELQKDPPGISIFGGKKKRK